MPTWHDDPLSVPQAYVPKTAEPDFRRDFWMETQDMRPTEGRVPVGTMRICRYLNGRHEMPPKPWCEHYNTHDETGPRIRPDWSVQDDGC